MKTFIETKEQEEISQKIKKLIEKKNMPKSFLSRFASAYANSSWWMKWGLGGLSLITGGILGFFISPFLFPSSPIIGAILGFLSYFLPTLILKKHHQAEFEHQQKLAEEVTKLEVILNDSIKTIQSLEKPVRSLMVSLEERNRERAHSNKLFRDSVESFKHQAEESEQAVQGLLESEEILVQQSQALSLELEQTTEAHKQLTRTQRDILQVSEELKGTKDSLVKDEVVLHDLVIDVEHQNNELHALHQKFKQIEADALETQREFQAHLTHSNTKARRTSETVEERQESSEALAEKVLANLERYLHSRDHRFLKGAVHTAEISSESRLTHS